MEQPPLEGKKSSIAKIIEKTKGYSGMSEFFREEAEENFLKVEKFAFEREKTDFEKKFIEIALRLLPDFLSRYGQKDYLPLREDHVCLIDESSFSSQFNQFSEEVSKKVGPDLGVIGGLWFPDLQRMLVFSQHPDDLEKLPIIFHEMMHAESFDSREVVDLDQTKRIEREQIRTMDIQNFRRLILSLRPRRSGLSVFGTKNNKFFGYFNQINEAVTQELAMAFAKENLPNFLEVDGKKVDEPWVDMVMDNQYRGFRQDLKKLINDISSREGATESPEEIFKVLSTAYFDGNIIPVARLIKETYGLEGWRHLAESSATEWGELEQED